MHRSRTELALAAGLLSLLAGSPGHAAEPGLEVGDLAFDSLAAVTEPVHAVSTAPVRLRVSGLEGEAFNGCFFYRWNAPQLVAQPGPPDPSLTPWIVFNLDTFGCPSANAGSAGAPAAGYTRVERIWDIGTLAAGVYEVRFITDGIIDFVLASTRIEVHPPNGLLRLRDGFQVSIERPTGGPLPGALAAPLSEESGYFTFFSPTNVEVTVKILDGRAINGHYWVFLASMTDQPFVATVLQNKNDCLNLPTLPKLACPWRDYIAPAGENRNFIDVEFPLDVPPTPDPPSAN